MCRGFNSLLRYHLYSGFSAASCQSNNGTHFAGNFEACCPFALKRMHFNFVDQGAQLRGSLNTGRFVSCQALVQFVDLLPIELS